MYFCAILLLLFISKYTYSVPPREVPELSQEALIPFTLEYATTIEEFLKDETGDFYVTLMGKIRMGLYSVMSSNFSDIPDNNCVTENTSSPPEYHLATDGDSVCKLGCIQSNVKYVQFMNQNISFLIEKLFGATNRLYCVKLNPIDSQTGECVNNEDKKVFECVCKTNYQIEVNTSLVRTMQRSMNNRVIATSFQELDNLRKTKALTAFMLLLKFHPITAPLFLGYLFRKYKISVENSAVMNLGINIPNLSGNVPGMIENKGKFIEKEEKLFKKIMKEISSTNSCDLRAQADLYFNKCRVLHLIIIGCLSYGVWTGFKNKQNSHVSLK